MRKKYYNSNKNTPFCPNCMLFALEKKAKLTQKLKYNRQKCHKGYRKGQKNSKK